MPHLLYAILLVKITLTYSKDSQLEFSFGEKQMILKIENDEDPLSKAIEFCLSNNDDSVKANAAAYLQHLSYNDDGIKAKTR